MSAWVKNCSHLTLSQNGQTKFPETSHSPRFAVQKKLPKFMTTQNHTGDKKKKSTEPSDELGCAGGV